MTDFAADLCGEWCDHATYEGRAENGKEMFHYGGDAGEFPTTETSAWMALYFLTEGLTKGFMNGKMRSVR